MDASQTPPKKAIGFVSVRERSPHGFFGGYLVVNELARPLEFHCTLPLQPTRAQRILFGSTLEEFVCGEQIARALLSKSKVQPDLVLTDCLSALAVRHWIDAPIFCLSPWESDGLDAERIEAKVSLGKPAEALRAEFQIPSFRREDSQYIAKRVVGYRFEWLQKYETDARGLEWLHAFGSSPIDLDEPFDRIVEALAEAHPQNKVA